MSQHTEDPTEPYQYGDLPTETAFRVLELLPGKGNDPISCFLHLADRSQPSTFPPFEAVSYAWGNPRIKVPVICHGKRVDVTPNLHSALVHFRYHDRSRFMWADAIW